jgi:hypothetical protein
MEKDLTLLEAMRAAIETIKAQSPQEYVDNVRAHSNSPIAVSIDSIAGDYRGISLQTETCETFVTAQSYSLRQDKGNALKYFAFAQAKCYSGAAQMAASLISSCSNQQSDYASMNAIAA